MRLESPVPLVPRPQTPLGLWQAQRWHLPWPRRDTQTPHTWGQATLRDPLSWQADGWQGSCCLHPGAWGPSSTLSIPVERKLTGSR